SFASTRHSDLVRSFPTRRSSDLENGEALMLNNDSWIAPETFLDFYMMEIARFFSVNEMVKLDTFDRRLSEGKHLSLMEFLYPTLDRKSTRLNSSHVKTSYAVFCL